MRKTLLLCAITVMLGLMSQTLTGQEFVKIKKAEFRTGDEMGLEGAWKNIKAGDKFFKAGKGTYREARELYLAAYQYNSENDGLNYKIGVCYLFSDDKFESIKYLTKAYVLNNQVAEDIHLMLAMAYHLTLEFDKAIKEYNEYKSSLHPKKAVEIGTMINRRIEECENGKVLVADPLRVIINNMSDSINSPADDYNSIFSPNDSILYFTSRRQHHPKAKRSAYDNKYFEDIYRSVRKGDTWNMAQNMGKSINSKKHNSAAVGISRDGKEIFIYRGDKDGGDIYVSRFKNGGWASPRSMPSRFNTKFTETTISVSPDGQQLFFVSANPKDSYGGRDIYISEKDERGKWQKPVNIGKEINTPYDEECVHMSPDGNTLYFSSKGHNSMGGYDVFKTSKNELNEWAIPENIGYPVNTPDDDVFYTLDATGRYAYYSANRMGGIGGKDIFRIVFLGSEKEMVMSAEDILVAGILDSTKHGFFIPPAELAIDTTYIVTGMVFNTNTEEGVVSKLEFIDVEKSQVVATSMSDGSGVYRASLPEAKAFGLEITARDYMFFLDIMDITGESTDEEIIRNFGLEPVEVGATVVLENIFFETGKATLKEESFIQLEQVLKFMQSNPTMRMEISGHTDNTGSLKVNTKLSQARAEAVVKWLVERGIDASRLDAMGYAFNQPIASNDTAEGRAQNRRVEFKILSK
jgi:outer membrane protein OmpA-like peptidoglycan-associated protein